MLLQGKKDHRVSTSFKLPLFRLDQIISSQEAYSKTYAIFGFTQGENAFYPGLGPHCLCLLYTAQLQ